MDIGSHTYATRRRALLILISSWEKVREGLPAIDVLKQVSRSKSVLPEPAVGVERERGAFSAAY